MPIVCLRWARRIHLDTLRVAWRHIARMEFIANKEQKFKEMDAHLAKYGPPIYYPPQLRYADRRPVRGFPKKFVKSNEEIDRLRADWDGKVLKSLIEYDMAQIEEEGLDADEWLADWIRDHPQSPDIQEIIELKADRDARIPSTVRTWLASARDSATAAVSSIGRILRLA